MAVLIQDDAQLRALEEINQMLEELRDLNLAIESQEAYSIRVNRKRSIVIDENLSGRVETVLRIQRSRRAKEITAKAACLGSTGRIKRKGCSFGCTCFVVVGLICGKDNTGRQQDISQQ